MYAQRYVRKDVLSVHRVANFVQCINQGVLLVGFERKMEIDRGAGGRVT
jgi:hypothetical protein